MSIFMSLTATITIASDLRKEINLRGRWKFEIGDDMKWANPEFDDSDWESIYVPERWEEDGYPGYDGYAWYRKQIRIPSQLKDNILYLLFGQIDDVDEVFFNGVKIGSTGNFPPDYRTAYNVNRKYYIPKNLVEFNEDNMIAVRVYDDQMGGGIVNGDLGIYSVRKYLAPDIELGGYWKFKTGDREVWGNEDYDDSHWDQIIVPGFWESQGYSDYDGFAWYRKQFIIPDDYNHDRIILMLGKIDDVDQVFFNGVRIGGTGPIPENDYRGQYGDWYARDRAYILPDDLIKRGSQNIIAVRIYDAWLDGGIYDIPVGIIRYDRYRRIERRKEDSVWDLFDLIFN
ncbi:glycoside hydrolase [candidate division KSB1 bacterium]|nr:glycoside hydrolase [candidate division KSB1 bacterium]